jgi:hypothetical protein
VKLEAEAKQFYDPNPVATPPVDAGAWEASFNDGATWVAPTDVTEGRPRWLVAGPESDTTGAAAVITQSTLRPRLRVSNPPEMVVLEGPYIWLV